MNYTSAIIQGIVLGLFIAISVGPTLFAVIRYSMHQSYKAGLAFVVGVSISDVMYVWLANVATDSLKFLSQHQKEVALIGSGLFIIMGLYGFLKKYKPQKPPRAAADLQISSSTYAKIAVSGFMMNALNPGVIIYWMGAATLVSNESPAIRFVLFGTCLGLVLTVDFLKVFLAEKIRTKLTLRKIMYLNKTSSLIILGLGLILLAKVVFNIELNSH